jgi:hypothetical protein
MGALPQALEIIFEFKWKGVMKQQQEEKETFQITKCICFLFEPLIFKAFSFLISYSF